MNQEFIKKYQTYILISIFAIIVLFAKWKKKTYENFHGLRPSKCFSCEKDLIKRKGVEWAWQGQVSKCFDCEKDLVNRLGPKFGALGGNNKTFNNMRIHPNIIKNKKQCKDKK